MRTRLEASYEQDMTYVPGEDEHGYAAAEAGWDDEEAYGEAYEEEGVTAAAEAPAPARRRRRWLVIAIAAVTVAVLAVGAAVFLLPSRTSAEPFRSYANTGSIVPYTLSRPQSWTPKEGTASDTVLSSATRRGGRHVLPGLSRPVGRHPPAAGQLTRRTR